MSLDSVQSRSFMIKAAKYHLVSIIGVAPHVDMTSAEIVVREFVFSSLETSSTFAVSCAS